MSASAKLRAMTPEGLSQLSANGKTSSLLPRGPFSDAAKANMRAAKLARPVRYWLGKVRGPHSAETIEKMRSVPRPPIPPHVSAKGHDAWRGSHHSKESLAKIKAALAKPDAKAKMRASVFGKPCRRKHGFAYNGMRMRSSYEVRVAAALDALGVPWTYESRRFDCHSFTYTPDFYLVDDEVYWEVKGWYGPDSQRKVSAFRRLYPGIPLVVFDLTCIKSLEAAVRVAA